MLLFRLGVLVTLLMSAQAAEAQPFEAYVTGGAGRWVHNTGSSGPLLAVAGGVEWLPGPYFGIGGEGGLLAGTSGDIAATLGVDARVHFRGTTPPGGWSPYAFVGYSPLAFFDLSDQGVSVGAGLDYRLSDCRALRFELRDIFRSSGSVKSHYWTARVGVTFG
jgi:hypothetical protein